MDELIAKLTQAAGIDAATAEKAVGIILNFLRQQAPAEAVDQATAAIPGAQQAADRQAQAQAGGIGGAIAGLGGADGRKRRADGTRRPVDERRPVDGADADGRQDAFRACA